MRRCLLIVSTFWVFTIWAAGAHAQSPKEVRKVAKQGPNAIPELERFLLNPDLKVRLEAVRGLIDIGGQHTIDPLVEATRDNDPEVQILAVNGLVNFYVPGYVRTGFAAPIRQIGSDVRSRFSDPDDLVIDPYLTVRPPVIQAIGHLARGGASLDSRANAARALGVLRGKSAVPDLIEALRSRDTDVLLETLIALEKIHDSSACTGIHFLLNDLDDKIQSEAIDANGLLGCKAARPDIRQIIGRTSRERVKRAALFAIAMMPEPSDRPLFQSYLENSDERLRTAAAEGFARLASIEDAHKLEEVFGRETRNGPRLAIAFALVMDGNLTMTEYAPLRFLLYSLNNNNYRPAALAYLTEAARNPDVRNALTASLDDDTRDEKVNLARVLAASGDRSSIPSLQKLSHDQDSNVASEGVRQLRNLQARI